MRDWATSDELSAVNGHSLQFKYSATTRAGQAKNPRCHALRLPNTRNQENRKEDAGDGGRARRLQAHGSSLLPASCGTDNCRWQLPCGLLIDVTRWQSPRSNSPVENFLLHRKRDPFFRWIWIGPQTAKLIDYLLFVLCHPLALE